MKAGLLTEFGEYQDTFTGTPQGGILSSLLANIALSVLDEHLHRPWEPGRDLSTDYRRRRRRAQGLPSWRLVRYADDFVVLVDGTRQHTEALHEEIAQVLAPMGLWQDPSGSTQRGVRLPRISHPVAPQARNGLSTISVTHYRYRGNKIPTSWAPATT